ncbi:MAG TPA: Fe-S cluster assembly protein SufD [Leptospiraceae bacterium]|nr:Fe-S cluster assembly protein SufD [Leptospiraceae bacterium]
MEALLSKTTAIETKFEAFLSSLEEPDWMIELRKSAFTLLKETSLPDSKLESWRKVNLSNFSLDSLLSTNRKICSFSINSDLIAANEFASVDSFDKVYIENTFNALLEKNKANFFALLNLSFFDIGILTKVPANTSIAEPIQLNVNYPQGESSFCPLLIWKLEKFSNASIYEKMNSLPAEDFNLINPLSYIEMENGAKSTFVTIEDFKDSTFHFRNLITNQGLDSELKLYHFNLGGYKGKTLVVNDLNGENANIKAIGATTLSKREFQDIEFTISHFASRTDSNLKFKTVVKDKSHHIFTGNLYIPKASFHVTASQVNNNLTMSRTARAESMPKLEVFADDVKCSHGATVGEVNAEQLFYLMSRGLTENESRFLIIEGFLKEILDFVTVEEIQNLLITRLTEKLYN